MSQFKYRLKEGFGAHYGRAEGKKGGLKRMKPGTEITVDDPSDLGGVAFKFELIETVPDEEEQTEVSWLEMKHVGGGRYNVVNTETGRNLNDDYLSKKEATALIAEQMEE